MLIARSKALGLDIADHTIEAAEVSVSGREISIRSKSRIYLDKGIVENGIIKDKEKLKQSLLELFKKAKPKTMKPSEIIFGIPESQVYFKIIRVNEYEKGSNLLVKKIKEVIPLEQEDLLYVHKVIFVNSEYREYMVFAASRQVITEWKNFFSSLGIKVRYFDIEPLAIFRGIFSQPSTKPVCLVDIGSKTTNISFFNKEGMRLALDNGYAGNYISEKIASGFKISFSEAESLKIKNGLTKKKNKILPVTEKCVGKIYNEVNKAVLYFQDKFKEEVGEIILVGGTSNMAGLEDYFKERFINIEIKKAKIPGKSDIVPLEYIEAVGLALRDLKEQTNSEDPYFSLDEGTEFKVMKKEENRLNKESEVMNESSIIVKNNKKRHLILFIILLFEFLLLVGVIWYQNKIKEEKKTYFNEQSDIFTINKLEAKAIISTEKTLSDDSLIAGRVYEDKSYYEDQYDEVVKNSYNSVLSMSDKNEYVWIKPVDIIIGEDFEENIDKQKGIPIQMKWLIFSKSDSRRIFSEKIKESVDGKQDTSFIIESIDYYNVEKTESANLYNIFGMVTVLSK